MNLNDIQNTWNSPRNNMPAAERERIAGKFTRQMIRRRRFRTLWLINTFAWLAVMTGIVGVTIVKGKMNPGLEWGVFPLVIALWAFAIHFLRKHLKSSAFATLGAMSVADSFRAAARSNRVEKTNLRRVAGLLALVVPLLALAMWQLHEVGKVADREVVPMAAFFAAALLVAGGGMAARYFAFLVPQQHRLDALLAELELADEAG